MANKNYKLKFEMSDGTTKTVNFTAPQGEKGDKGDTGATGAAGAKGADGVGIVNITISEVGDGYTLTIESDGSNGNCELYINGVKQSSTTGTWTGVTTVGVKSLDGEPWMLLRDTSYSNNLVEANCDGSLTTVTMTQDETIINIDK